MGNSGRSVLGWREDWLSFNDMCQNREVRNCWQSVRDRLEVLPVQRDCFGFIHNDPHAENILIIPNHIALVDFDVANYHLFINDIAITLHALLFKQTGGLNRPLVNATPLRRFLDGFMEGYSWVNNLDLLVKPDRSLYRLPADHRVHCHAELVANKAIAMKCLEKMFLEEPPILG